MTYVLDLQNVSGGYTADRPVLHDVSFGVKSSEIVGLIGLNGAGKSTTIKHVLGLLEPTSGSILVNGKSFLEAPEHYRSQFTYIPETPSLYEELTLWEHLKVTAMAYDVDEARFHERAEKLLHEFRMVKMKHWFPSQFSKGMKQKVMIMCAFLVEPRLYVVDEPFVGLDPLGIQSFLDWMVKFKKNGAGVLMSTHILATAEKYCDRFIILHEGRVAMQGTVEQLRDQSGMAHASLDDIYLKVAQGDVD
mgnify:CR=1 FL=1